MEDESEKISGDFAMALEILISRLTRARNGNKLASELLQEWDQRRGNDWFTSTRKMEEDEC